MTYQVDITLRTADVLADTVIADWTIVQDDDGGEVSDDVTVLAGLLIGWAVPNGLWPAQPDPMTCELAINLPHFDDVTVDVSDRLAVEVRADTAGDVIASFYGRVTDYRAVPRGETETGVTLSLVAVDYTVDAAELMGVIVEPDALDEEDVARAAWGQFAGTDDVSDVWTSPSRVVNAIPEETVQIVPFVNALLAQAVNLADQTRMVWSPVIGDGGRLIADLSSGRIFTLDTISSDTAYDTDPYSPPADAVLLDGLQWNITKGGTLGLVAATGWGDGTGTVTAVVPGLPNNTIQTMRVICALESLAQDTVDFYAIPFDSWQLSTLVVEVSRKALEVPAGLFPDWTLDEGDPGRGACYNRAVIVDGTDSTRTPDGSEVIAGLLTGAVCRIDGPPGDVQLTLELALRRPD